MPESTAVFVQPTSPPPSTISVNPEPVPYGNAGFSPAPASRRIQWRLKRCTDIVCSSFGLVVLSPLLLLVAVLIRLDSPGPCLLKQKRVGYLGREFEMLKFRTMVVDTDKQVQSTITQDRHNALMVKMDKDDPRITGIGKWLRKFSIDELPQLWNVLKGDMSLVGPRPLLIENVRRHKRSYLRRLATLPGLTCYWQISGRSNIRDFEQVLKLDEQYISQWSIWRDFVILLKTIPVVLYAKGAV